MTDVTRILSAIEQGDPHASAELLPLVYKELKKLAAQRMAQEKPGQTLQATALVHEAYLKLIDVDNVNWEHRAHFFAVSSQIMRRILLDRARRRVAAKRGGKAAKVNLDEIPDLSTARAGEMIALDGALNALAEMDPRKAQVIEMRFFGGLSVEEAATILKVSEDTVHRDWRLARAWLLAELKKGG